jgi:hypothetical protein
MTAMLAVAYDHLFAICLYWFFALIGFCVLFGADPDRAP